MKGIVFTEFIEMVEGAFGLGMVNDLIAETAPPSGGTYVSTGTYDHAELVAMVMALSRRTGKPAADLLVEFGRFLAPRFRKSFPAFFAHSDLFDFLDSVDGYIHVEVRKLYPDAELPRLARESRTAKRMVLRYTSPRRLSDFGRGLIEGVAMEFGTPVTVRTIPVDDLTVKFEVTLTDQT